MSDQASRLRNLVEERAIEEAKAREIGELYFRRCGKYAGNRNHERQGRSRQNEFGG